MSIPPELDLAPIAARLARATPGPWYLRVVDDPSFAQMVVVTTNEGERHNTRWEHVDKVGIVASTLVQTGPVFCHESELYDQNADFIANCPNDIALLIAEIERLRSRRES